uniref:CD81 molecule n=2 Tax=Canis lupus familiaris TaxID=9615 RepID=A0A8P0TK51_CANLF
MKNLGPAGWWHWPRVKGSAVICARVTRNISTSSSESHQATGPLCHLGRSTAHLMGPLLPASPSACPRGPHLQKTDLTVGLASTGVSRVHSVWRLSYRWLGSPGHLTPVTVSGTFPSRLCRRAQQLPLPWMTRIFKPGRLAVRLITHPGGHSLLHHLLQGASLDCPKRLGKAERRGRCSQGAARPAGVGLGAPRSDPRGARAPGAGRGGAGRGGGGAGGGAGAPYNRRRGRARGQRASAQRRRSTQRAPARPPAPRAPRPRVPAPRAPAPRARAPPRRPPGPAPRAPARPGPPRAPRRPLAARAAMGVEGCTKCIKYLLFVFNFVFWLAGGVILGVALWLRHDPQTTNLLYLELGDRPAPNTFYVGIYILIAVGAVMMFVGFLGCYGAIQESQCLLGTFFTCLVILFACEVAAGIWGFVNKDQIAKDVKQFYDQALQQAVVKTFHETLNCCGSSTLSALTTSMLKNSLCPSGSNVISNLFKEDCHQKIDDLFSGKLYLIGIAAIVVAVIMIFEMILSMVLCCGIRNSSVY